MKPIIACVLFLFLTSSYSKTIEVNDFVGRKIKLNSNHQKIICLGPGALRIITYLNASHLVVGVEQFEKLRPKGRPYWLANKGLNMLPVIGPGGPAGIGRVPDLEKVLKVRPDVIFVTMMTKKKADLFQKEINIPVVVLSYGRFASFDEVVLDSIMLAGKIVGKEKRAKEIINFVKRLKDDLKKRSRNINLKKRVYIGAIGFKGGHGIESTDSSYIPFEWLNVLNVAQKIKMKGHHFINKEHLLTLNPDYIFIDGLGRALFLEDYKRRKTFYYNLSAFKNKKVFSLFPFNLYTTNIGTVFVNSYAIGKTLYPKEYEDIDLSKKAQEIYGFFVGKKVFFEMEKDFGKLLEIF